MNINSILIFALVAIYLLSLIILTFKFFKRWYIFLIIYFLSLGTLIYLYQKFSFKILLYLGLPSILLGSLIGLMLLPEKLDDLWDVPFLTNKGQRVIKNIKRGVLIFGSAGSGKTESPILIIFRFFAEKLFTGVFYDYKDGELTELALPLFGNRLKIICVHNPKIGGRVNLVSPKYINDVEIDINEIVMVLISNLKGKDSKDDFFIENACSLFSGILIKLFLDHPNYCTIPHAIAIILSTDLDDSTNDEEDDNFPALKNFLNSNIRSKMQSSAFLLGLSSKRQTGAVLSTLANLLRKISFPKSFWVLSQDNVDLNVNDKNINTILSVINLPKNDNFLAPFTSTIIHVTTKQMMQRDKLPSFVLLDEAPTIKLLNMAKIPATMRSFGVAVIYCAQDIVQGYVKYNRDGFREIMANLSTQIFGKANDPETAKFYESYFEFKEIDQKSISKKGGGGFFESGGTTGTTTSKKEVRKVRAEEFNKFKAGQFAFISNGKSEIIKFDRLTIEKEKLPENSEVTDVKIDDNFNKIILESKNLMQKYLN